ncbi:potassium channel family protein [Vibrio vulnificus]
MKKLFKLKAYVYALCYLSLIPIFALIYSLVDLSLGVHAKGLVTYLYFSVVSITTLGYGDILPNSSWAQIAAASESLLGIILIGLFLNALSLQHSQ